MQIEGGQKSLIIDEKFAIPITQNFFQENKRGYFKLESYASSFYHYLLREHQNIQFEIYRKFPFPKDSIQIAQFATEGPCSLDNIKFTIKNNVGDEIQIQNIQPTPDKDSLNDDIKQKFFFLRKDKWSTPKELKIFSQFQWGKIIRQIIADLCDVFQIFSNYGLFPDAHPNLYNILMYIDVFGPIFIYIPTYYCQSRYMASKNCKKIIEIVPALSIYRQTIYETIVSTFFNNLCWVLNNSPLEDIILDEDNQERTADKQLEDELKNTNDILNRLRKDTKQYFPQNNRYTSQEILGKLGKAIVSIEQYWEYLQKNYVILFGTATEIRCLPLYKRTRKSAIQESLLLNSIFSHNLKNFRIELRKMLKFEQQFVRKAIYEVLSASQDYKHLQDDLKKMVHEEYDRYNDSDNLRNLLTAFFIQLEKKLITIIQSPQTHPNCQQLLELPTPFLSKYLELKQKDQITKQSEESYEFFTQNTIRQLIYPLENICMMIITKQEQKKDIWKYIQNFIQRSRLTIKQQIKQADQKNAVTIFEVTVTNPGINSVKMELSHTIEFLEQKNCLVIKTQAPDMNFNIETGDDIIFLMNLMSRYNQILNTHINEQRKLILQSTICLGNPIQVIQQIIEGFDQHMIMAQILIDYYKTFIEKGLQTKDGKYLSLMNEIIHYVNQYKDYSKELWAQFLVDNEKESYLF